MLNIVLFVMIALATQSPVQSTRLDDSVGRPGWVAAAVGLTPEVAAASGVTSDEARALRERLAQSASISRLSNLEPSGSVCSYREASETVRTLAATEVGLRNEARTALRLCSLAVAQGLPASWGLTVGDDCDRRVLARAVVNERRSARLNRDLPAAVASQLRDVRLDQRVVAAELRISRNRSSLQDALGGR